jgi:hypothetical protein
VVRSVEGDAVPCDDVLPELKLTVTEVFAE